MAVSLDNGVLGQKSLGNEHDQIYFIAVHVYLHAMTCLLFLL